MGWTGNDDWWSGRASPNSPDSLVCWREKRNFVWIQSFLASLKSKHSVHVRTDCVLRDELYSVCAFVVYTFCYFSLARAAMMRLRRSDRLADHTCSHMWDLKKYFRQNKTIVCVDKTFSFFFSVAVWVGTTFLPIAKFSGALHTHTHFSCQRNFDVYFVWRFLFSFLDATESFISN